MSLLIVDLDRISYLVVNSPEGVLELVSRGDINFSGLSLSSTLPGCLNSEVPDWVGDWGTVIEHMCLSRFSEFSNNKEFLFELLSLSDFFGEMVFSRGSENYTLNLSSVFGFLYAYEPYRVVVTQEFYHRLRCTDDPFLFVLFKISLEYAEFVISEESLVQKLLEEDGVSSVTLADFVSGFRGFEVNHKNQALKQKKSEVEYEFLYGDRYDEKYHGAICYQLMDSYLVEILSEASLELRKKKEISVLDLACGPGSLFSKITSIDNVNYLGVDLSSALIAQAKQKYGEGYFEIGDAEFLMKESGSVDLVLCSGMLHHFPDMNPVLDEIQRVLSPGGVLVVREPNSNNFAEYQPEVAMMHLCLKNIIHAKWGTAPVVEPEEHEFHRSFKVQDLANSLSSKFKVKSVFTNQRVSHFYDMLVDQSLSDCVSELENSLIGVPGLNVVFVCEKNNNSGLSILASERIEEYLSPRLPAMKRHFVAISRLYHKVVGSEPIPILVKCDNPSSYFKQCKPKLLGYCGPVSAYDKFVKAYESESGECLGDKTILSYRLNDSVAFESYCLLDYLKIYIDEEISVTDLIAQVLRAKDFSIIDIEFSKSGLLKGSYSQVTGSVLESLCEVCFLKTAGETRSILKRNSYTRVNLRDNLESLIERYKLNDDEILSWLEVLKKDSEIEFESKFSCGGFFEYIKGSLDA